MGRTVQYKIYCQEEELRKAWPTIEDIQKKMNDRYDWTVEHLTLAPTDEEDRKVIFNQYWLSEHPTVPTAWGFTKVGDDDWNALLVFRFMRWVSTQIRGANITVHDEGNYARVGYLEVTAGRWDLDWDGLWKNRAYLRKQRMDTHVAEQEFAVTQALAGRWFFRLGAFGFTDRPEIKALGLTSRDVSLMTIDEIADLIRFPWQEPSA